MNYYTDFEKELVDAACNAMLSRLNILDKLVNFTSAGAESWFQWEFALSPWCDKWELLKRRSYDLEIRDKQNNVLEKLEIKCCTDKNFNWVSDWLYPKRDTKNKTAQNLRQQRKDVKALFLAINGSQNNFNNLQKDVFVTPPYWMFVGYSNPKWIVGILKRK